MPPSTRSATGTRTRWTRSVLLALLTAREDTDDPDHADTSARLQQVLADLPPEQAKPIVMMAYYGFTATAIAASDDIHVGTVKTWVRRGLGLLRQRMGVRDA
jgi:DNA-directed RNA polymerase specialized sigma24 family protein